MAGTRVCPQCGASYDSDIRFCPKDGATLRATAGSDLTGQVIADRYHVIRKLGEGGMGRVYLAEHLRMKRKSAVKVMSAKLAHDHDAVSRFNREAENASQIDHPNVARIYDFGETGDGLIYLAMEFIDGESLTRVVEREGALDLRRASMIASQVAAGLAAAHELGIVHRDLKPDNIMIGRARNGAEIAKVVDFGIAKAVDSIEQSVTRTGLSVGTPEYMSPEQLAGDTFDSRTDLYSLALVTFNMLTGDLPFPKVTSKEALIMRLTEKPRTLASVRADRSWPPALQSAMDRALATEPDARYRHVAEFTRDLESAAHEAPIRPSVAARAAPTTVAEPVRVPTVVLDDAPLRGVLVAPPPGARSRAFVPTVMIAMFLIGAGGAGGVFAVRRFGGAPEGDATPAQVTDSVALGRAVDFPKTNVADATAQRADSARPVRPKQTVLRDTPKRAIPPAAVPGRPATPASMPLPPAGRPALDSVELRSRMLGNIRQEASTAVTMALNGDFQAAGFRMRTASNLLQRVRAVSPPNDAAVLSTEQLVRQNGRIVFEKCDAARRAAISGGAVPPRCQMLRPPQGLRDRPPTP